MRSFEVFALLAASLAVACWATPIGSTFVATMDNDGYFSQMGRFDSQTGKVSLFPTVLPRCIADGVVDSVHHRFHYITKGRFSTFAHTYSTLTGEELANVHVGDEWLLHEEVNPATGELFAVHYQYQRKEEAGTDQRLELLNIDWRSGSPYSVASKNIDSQFHSDAVHAVDVINDRYILANGFDGWAPEVSPIWSIDTNGGQVTVINGTVPFGKLTSDPADSTLWGICSKRTASVAHWELCRVDARSGEASFFPHGADLRLTHMPLSVAVDPATHQIYMNGNPNEPQTMSSIQFYSTLNGTWLHAMDVSPLRVRALFYDPI